jgi:pilus assembly protein CpaC
MKAANFTLLATLLALAVLPAGAQQASIQSWTSLKPDAAAVQVDVSKIGKEFRITVGQSLDFDNATTEYERVYVDNPEYLSAYAVNPHRVIVSGKGSGKAALILSDKSGAINTYSVQVDTDVAPLQAAVENDFPFDKINVSADQDAVVLTGYVTSKDEFDAISKLATGYGKKVFNSLRVARGHVREVRLQVKFAEVDRAKLQEASFNLLSLGKSIGMSGTGQTSAFSLPSLGSAAVTAATLSNPMQLLLFNQGLNLGAALQDLEQKNVLQILAEPTISALSGHVASFLSGGEFPFPMVQPGSSGTSATVTVQLMPYGVQLNFEPTVLDDGTIRLHVAPQVSALDYTNEAQIDGYTIPGLSTRQAETDIELRDGQSFALSGLLDHRITNAFSSMPGISNIPIIGRLFKSKSAQASTTDLLVVVTATIVDSLSLPGPSPDLPQTPAPYLDKNKFDASLPRKQN